MSDEITATTDERPARRTKRMPVVAIVGRPNVGKSSLLNAIVGKRISIVQDQPGVTRDRVSFPLRVGDRFVELIDTGGYGFVDPDALTEHIRHQIRSEEHTSELQSQSKLVCRLLLE